MGCWAGAVPIILCKRGAPTDTSHRLRESFIIASSEGADRCQAVFRLCFWHRPLRFAVYAESTAVVGENCVHSCFTLEAGVSRIIALGDRRLVSVWQSGNQCLA